MELSNYNILISDFPKKDYTLAYNLLSKEYICLRSKLFNELDINNKYITSLLEKGFLVDSENKDLENAMKLFMEKQLDSTLRLTVLLTRKCNCSCIYCYQDAYKQATLGIEEIDRIIDFADKYMKENNLSNLEVVYFGGEPLLKKELITYSSKIWHEKFGNKFKFSIITNGTLLKEKDVAEWKIYNLKSIKITLDGVEETHNKRRSYKSGMGSFEDITGNIAKVQNLVEIIINIVLDENNAFDAQRLVYWLKNKRFNVSICLNLTRIEGHKESLKAMEALVRLARHIKVNNIYQYSSIGNPDGGVCSYKKKHNFSIDSNLNFYSCNSQVDKSDKSVGDINSLTFYKKMNLTQEKCEKCKFLPVCFYGCQSGNSCKREYYERTIPELVKIYSGLD